MSFRKNKKGQIGETLTWVVGTMAIILILGITFFVISSAKLFNKSNYESAGDLKSSDILASKSLAGYLMTSDASGTVFQQLLNQGDLKIFFNDFNGNLAKNILLKMYSPEYRKIWLGVHSGNRFQANKFFGGVGISGVYDEINLNQSESIFMTMTK